MGLDGFKENDQENSSSTKKEYIRIKQYEFEEFLEALRQGRFYIIGTQEDVNLNFTREIVYACDLPDENDDLRLRIYSTIDKRTARARDKGDDAIRTVIWSNSISQPIAGKTKTLRIKTWRQNLGPKIEELLQKWDTRVIKCDNCGAWMVRRDGQYGEFYGCSKYPICENTKQVEQVEKQFDSLSPKEIKKEEEKIMENVFGEDY